MADTVEETVDTASETLVLSEQEKAELAEFVASQMFSNLQFNQVLLTIENQCRGQAQQVVEDADAETIGKIREDLTRLRAENQMLGGAAVQQGAAQVPQVPTPPSQ